MIVPSCGDFVLRLSLSACHLLHSSRLMRSVFVRCFFFSNLSSASWLRMPAWMKRENEWMEAIFHSPYCAYASVNISNPYV